MNEDRPSQPPYFDWRIDRWKVSVLLLLFAALLLWALMGWP
jgi:hypothetical protein